MITEPITKEQFLNTMSNEQIFAMVTDSTSELLKITEYEAEFIKNKNFQNFESQEDRKRSLIREIENLDEIISQRQNFKQDISQNKKDKFKKINHKLLSILKESKNNMSKLISINKLVLEAVSSSIAEKQKLEYGYDSLGNFVQEVVIKKNTQPLNLNEKC